MAWGTCVFLLCVTAVLADGDWLEVEIEQGPVRGAKDPNGDLYAFYNIPYATGPTGENKFKAPLPPPNWTEPFNATAEKYIVCPQNHAAVIDLMQDVLDEKEDCLIANVFVPDTTQKDLSVLVYVHGGGFFNGFGNLYRGTQFIREKKDFIMVTFNYRLHIHGFLCLGTEDIPGNAGMKDQVELLRWVQKNIASFGGNPNDVTLVGSSAGSASVDLLMLSKSAENLFHRVIPESGGSLAAFSIQRDPLELAKEYAKKINEQAMVDDINSLERFYKTTSLDAMNAVPIPDRTDIAVCFSPCVERNMNGAFLTESPLTILKKGDYKKLPMLYGFANMEGLLRINLFETWKNKMNDNFSDFLPADLQFGSDTERLQVANTVKQFYFDSNPVSNENILKYVDFFSDVIFTFPMLWASKLFVEAGHNQVYLYEYSFVDENTPVVPHTDDVRGADHCAQTFAWLDPFVSSPETPEYQKMRGTVREIWHNFMKTGTPVPEGSSLPSWPAIGADGSPHMVLNATLELQGVLLPLRKSFWEGIYDKHYLDSVPPASGAGSMVQTNMFTLLTIYVLFYFTRKIIVE